MRISELSRVSGVPVATIKFYLREGLRARGRADVAEPGSVRRRARPAAAPVRALVGVGGLSLAATKNVLGHIDQPTGLTLDLLGTAHQAVAPELPDEVDLTPAVSLLRRLGWDACADAVGSDDEGRVDDALAGLAVALAALDDAGFVVEPERMDTLRRRDDAGRPRPRSPGCRRRRRAAAVRYVVLGTVLVEPVLLALRRLAQREASAARFPLTSSDL